MLLLWQAGNQSSCCAACRKTLQGITLLWTLLQNGHDELGGTPMAKRIIICCPTSLVSNWDSECTKWLKACHCDSSLLLASSHAHLEMAMMRGLARYFLQGSLLPCASQILPPSAEGHASVAVRDMQCMIWLRRVV